MTTYRRPLSPTTIAVLLSLALAGCGLAGTEDASDRLPEGGAGTIESMSTGERTWAYEVLALVNEERAAVGLPALHWHEEASQAAYAHSFDMDVRSFFSHTNPDGVGPGGRLAAQGIEFDAIGENIAKGFASPREVVQGWMESSGHRASILDPEFTGLGVGIHTTKHDGPWWTQDFLR